MAIVKPELALLVHELCKGELYRHTQSGDYHSITDYLVLLAGCCLQLQTYMIIDVCHDGLRACKCQHSADEKIYLTCWTYSEGR